MTQFSFTLISASCEPFKMNFPMLCAGDDIEKKILFFSKQQRKKKKEGTHFVSCNERIQKTLLGKIITFDKAL